MKGDYSIRSISLARHGRLMQVLPPVGTSLGIRIEVDSKVPKDEIWFVSDGKPTVKVKIQDQEKANAATL